MPKSTDSARIYLAFEGPIAAGKTTLAKLFARRYSGHALLEDFEHNEFLEDYYADAERWALPMQLGFLAMRHRQLSDVPTDAAPVFADHTYLKDAAFARVLLSDRSLRLYEAVSYRLMPVPAPNVVVFLDAPNDVLLRRIASRGRPYEAVIDGPYLDKIRDAYGKSLPPSTPRVDTSEVCLADHERVDRFLCEVFEKAKSAIQEPP